MMSNPPTTTTRDTGAYRQIIGVLHAAAVSDQRVTLVIHPDGGGPPVPLSYQDSHLDSVRALLCCRVTATGTIHTDPTGDTGLDLTHLTTAGPRYNDYSRTAPPPRPTRRRRTVQV